MESRQPAVKLEIALERLMEQWEAVRNAVLRT